MCSERFTFTQTNDFAVLADDPYDISFFEDGRGRRVFDRRFTALNTDDEALCLVTDTRFADGQADEARSFGNGELFLLNDGKSPSRKAGEIDNRGSHFYLTKFWADELAKQTEDAELAKIFAPVATALNEHEAEIAAKLIEVQGAPVDLGGYYSPCDEKTTAVMRPSETFNAIIDGLK